MNSYQQLCNELTHQVFGLSVDTLVSDIYIGVLYWHETDKTWYPIPEYTLDDLIPWLDSLSPNSWSVHHRDSSYSCSINPHGDFSYEQFGITAAEAVVKTLLAFGKDTINTASYGS